MRRTLPMLLAAGLALLLVLLADDGRTAGSSSAGAAIKAAAAQLPPAPASSVVSPTPAILAEMNRRQGTPRRVTKEFRRHARAVARAEARIRARQEAAARRAAAARAAAAQRTEQASLWYDGAASAHDRSTPSSSAELAWLNSGRGGWVDASGFARAPAGAPDAIRRVIQAGNVIARSPYKWGGGHGVWRDTGYDCSGSVSYALAYGGLLGTTLNSGQLMSWGEPGPGRWLTVYANEGHVFMYVAGLRFDTSGRAGDHSSRWQLSPRSADGFVMRHYPGL